MDINPVPNPEIARFSGAWFVRTIKQFSKFIIVGGVNTGIDVVILRILVGVTGITGGIGIVVLNAVSFSVAVVNSYFMNKFWTFEDKTRTEKEPFKFSQFFAVSLIGISINSGVVYIITTFTQPMFGLSPENWVVIAKLLATGFSLVWNFVGYKLFVFKK